MAVTLKCILFVGLFIMECFSFGYLFPYTTTKCSSGNCKKHAKKSSDESTLDFIKRIVTQQGENRLSFRECNTDSGSREDCGYFGMDEDDCYKRGCCWGEEKTPGVPWCYHSKRTTSEAKCMSVKYDERVECGFYGIKQNQCISSGCCWMPTNEYGVPWCYHKEVVPVFPGQCGTPAIHPSISGVGRIVGGSDAVPHSWPWIVSLGTWMDHFCGGSLITPEWVLTAAHCLPGFDYYGEKAVVGMHHMKEENSYQQQFDVVEIIPHPDYGRAKDYDADIMLVKLSQPVTLSDQVSLVCLPDNTDNFTEGMRTYTAGWGDLSEGGRDPDILQQVMVPLIGQETCGSEDFYGERLTDHMFCAGYEEGGRDSCQGDSGGPLVVYSNDRWVLLGIVSWGDGCAGVYKPGIYTNVPNFVQWVDETIAENS